MSGTAPIGSLANITGSHLYYPTAYQTIAAFRPRKRRPRKFRFDYKNSAADRKTFSDTRKQLRKQVGYRKPSKKPKKYPGSGGGYSSHKKNAAYKPWWSYL